MAISNQCGVLTFTLGLRNCTSLHARVRMYMCVCFHSSQTATFSRDLIGGVIAFRPLPGQLLPRLRACPLGIVPWGCSAGRGRKTGQERVRAWPLCPPAWQMRWLTVSSEEKVCGRVCASVCSSRRFSEYQVRKMKRKPKNFRLAASPK